MPRGGRHAGGAHTAPSGIQGRPRNSPDYYYFSNCGVTTVVHFLWAAPPSVCVDVWIDNIRIAGSKSGATLWEAQVLRNADSCHASMGEDHESGATHYTFLGVQFDHTRQAVSLSDRFVRSVRAMPSLNSSTIAEMEITASRLLYAAAIFCTRLCAASFSARQCDDDYPHLTGELCGRHPRRTFGRQRLARASDCDTSSRTIASESSSSGRKHRPPSSRTHRSMDGEPFLFQIQAMLKPPEKNGGGVLFLSCRPRCARCS
ncbi:putative target of rapamycin (TOR) kinase 1 [Trypanosoma cruzi]|uniref:Putative target of rapamycin (TOR) kinase 1 n=1 Tax=Trypanosoma cruzi TaxID=5693 RepID=A0A2V2XDT1_TRYCR|nr:putative target of rapamycin (TOR) kinase 1 [Trypanosoma cruzi]